jgi:hypothetical protein
VTVYCRNYSHSHTVIYYRMLHVILISADTIARSFGFGPESTSNCLLLYQHNCSTFSRFARSAPTNYSILRNIFWGQVCPQGNSAFVNFCWNKEDPQDYSPASVRCCCVHLHHLSRTPNQWLIFPTDQMSRNFEILKLFLVIHVVCLYQFYGLDEWKLRLWWAYMCIGSILGEGRVIP